MTKNDVTRVRASLTWRIGAMLIAQTVILLVLLRL